MGGPPGADITGCGYQTAQLSMRLCSTHAMCWANAHRLLMSQHSLDPSCPTGHTVCHGLNLKAIAAIYATHSPSSTAHATCSRHGMDGWHPLRHQTSMHEKYKTLCTCHDIVCLLPFGDGCMGLPCMLSKHNPSLACLQQKAGTALSCTCHNACAWGMSTTVPMLAAGIMRGY